jgi:Cd(II)/Pb(II)-responsive transcriptional regulator
MKIGVLSKVSGCSIQTIRYYEKEGLLRHPVRSEGNFRLYDTESLKELEFVKHCRSLDIPLSDIKQLITLKQNPKDSCSSVNELIDKQLQLVNRRINELNSLKASLQDMSLSCHESNMIEDCGILKTLDE